MSDLKAITKIQSLILIVIIIVSTLGGVTAYILLSESAQSEDSIKIGVIADLDMSIHKAMWRGVLLAAEQINAKGGILGKQLEIIGEDSDSTNPNQDISFAVEALTRLISVHKVDFIISIDGQYHLAYQDIIAEHEKILFDSGAITNEYTQRVEDNYQKYKYYFRTVGNATQALLGMTDCIETIREYSGFNKIAWLGPDLSYYRDFLPIITNYLTDVYEFEIVYQDVYSVGTLDFSSYLTAIESSGAEILVPFIVGEEGIILVRDWYDRQSPFVMWGFNSYVGQNNGWEITEGKCEYTTNTGYPTVAGYPLTSLTLPFRDAYFERWGEIPSNLAASAYDTVRFILYDALKRAGTTETEAVITALEQTSIETSLAENFVFTSNHDVMSGENINNPEEDYMIVMLFQWQNGKQVPMYPKSVKEEAGATYFYPPWPGPWD